MSHESRAPIPTLGRVREMANLVLIEAPVQTVHRASLEGRTGSLQAIMIIHGTVTIGSDFGQARFIEFNPRERRACLSLPRPRVTDVRIDLEQSEIEHLGRTGFWRVIPWSVGEGELINELLQTAECSLKREVPDDHLQDQARAQAEQVVADVFHGSGWQLAVRWE